MISSIISRLVILVFGTLYPAYASYKAVRTKNLKEYVKWMMYWIVFALFTCTETFTDMFLSWFPFYYEVKIVLVLWLLSPATKGSSILYRKFVHPALCRREQEIDEYIAKAKDQGYHTVLNLGTKGVNYATTVIMQTAIKGGGGLVQQLRKSYSLSDLTECDPRDEHGSDEADDVLAEPRLIRRAIKSAYATRRSASETNNRQTMYFPEVDVDIRGPKPRTDEPDFSHIKSTDDISSGYSSADNSTSLTRTASVGASSRSRARTTRTTVTTIKRPHAAEDNEVIIEELHEDDTFDSTMPPLVNLNDPLYLSHTVPPFIYQYVGDQVKIIQVLGNFPTNSEEHSFASVKRDQELISQRDLVEKDLTEIEDNTLIASKYKEVEGKIDNTEKCIDLIDNNEKADDIQIFKGTYEDLNSLDSDRNTKYEHPIENTIKDQIVETESVTSLSDIYSAESDDEASFDTPEPTPKPNKKFSKGKYGKNKAPLPPKLPESDLKPSLEIQVNRITIDLADKNDTLKDHIIDKFNQNTEITQRRSKSKSPLRLPSPGSNSGLGMLLHFPSKLAFWSKTNEQSKSNVSINSNTDSRRSSGKLSDTFESCSNIIDQLGEDNSLTAQEIVISQENIIKNNNEDNVPTPQSIIVKSVELQKAINAKLESHPEYKFVSLHGDVEEVPTFSKSTDV
ncbi:uncharacterized protein LOC126975195 isoform X2 [Leptidea sinapis]|uniref:uncharacterized protein LOC126975195 isoform X2 n=1 Tax=Leptidea sinapis TaxID=189913 RepID=UPI0021319D84|nr:uncharacterized protein LOC126975195 isoform X2 [Leptidea sinapis]